MPTQGLPPHRRSLSLAERTDETSEQSLAAFWTAYVEAGRSFGYLLRNPRASWAAFRAWHRLPVVEATALSDTSSGRAVRRVLEHRASYGIPARLFGTAILEIPEDGDQFLAARRARTLRRKIRSAERYGLKVRRIEDPAERQTLIETANYAEQHHVDPSYRVRQPQNDDLLDLGLWHTVNDQEGRPLLLLVVPYDGEFATLRYFRTLGWSDLHSDARYLATAALVAELAQCGVRYLLDTATPAELTNGLRHFQRIVGFRYARVKLRY